MFRAGWRLVWRQERYIITVCVSAVFISMCVRVSLGARRRRANATRAPRAAPARRLVITVTAFGHEHGVVESLNQQVARAARDKVACGAHNIRQLALRHRPTTMHLVVQIEELRVYVRGVVTDCTEGKPGHLLILSKSAWRRVVPRAHALTHQ